MEPVLHFADEAVAMAYHGPLLILVWRGAPTSARLVCALDLMRARAAALGSALGAVVLIEEGAPPPTPEALAFVAAKLEGDPPRMSAMAGVIEATGAQAAIVLEASEELSAAMGGHVALKTCFDLDEACAWLIHRMLPRAGSSARRELAVAVEKVRAAIEPSPT